MDRKDGLDTPVDIMMDFDLLVATATPILLQDIPLNFFPLMFSILFDRFVR